MRYCRVSKTPISPILDFGKQPLGNGFLTAEKFDQEYFYPMRIGFSEESKLVQLLDQPDAQQMFHENYAFYSSTSIFMGIHFKEFARFVMNSGYLVDSDPFVMELGCNDGIMLKHFAEADIQHLGIEPSRNVADVANKQGVRTLSEFFNAELTDRILRGYGQVDAFLAANVLCHISDITGVVSGIKKLLKPTGVVVFEDPYLGDIIEKTSYDQIYDEHVFLFSAHSVQYLFNKYGMELIDLQPQKTHGGSMRYVLSHQGVYPVNDTVPLTLQKEKNQGLNKIKTFHHFCEKVSQSRSELISLLQVLKTQGKRVVGYGATSKSTTILNYCGIGAETIEYISDTTPIKQGKFSPGMHIPIKPYDEFQNNPPDYAMLFAWNHAEEIIAKEQKFLKSGGKWITHVPQVRIL
jgi:2-polyprenyl-3-methyl-5-hydroxy-6-metoxy-1,4-benzoquinol methylase